MHSKRFQSRIHDKEIEKGKANMPQTKQSGGTLLEKFYAYLSLHGHALFSSLGLLLKTPLTTVMTIMVLALAIASASGFYVLLANVEQFSGNLEASNQISLFLKKEIDDSDGQKLADKIQQSEDIKSVKLITKEQALSEFRAYSGFGEALDTLEENPLPTVIQVLPKNSLDSIEEIEQLVDQFKQLKEVDIAQMDMQWVHRLQSMIDLARRGVILLSVVISFAVLFIMGNTIRLELEDRRDEVLIAKLVGATYAFIQRPFLYTGFWFGFLAGACAWLMVTLMMLFLKRPIEKLSGLYEGGYDVVFLNLSEGLLLLFISAMLGVLGSWIVLHYQLRQMKLE